jgi:hypothetical protein
VTFHVSWLKLHLDLNWLTRAHKLALISGVLVDPSSGEPAGELTVTIDTDWEKWYDTLN